MTTNEFNDKSMNFRVIRRFRVEWLYGGELGPETPWEDLEENPVLAFGPGLLWGNGAIRSLEWTNDPYEAGTGIATTPSTFTAARYQSFAAITEGDSITYEHNFGRYPLVQALEDVGGDVYELFDLHGAGGFVRHSDPFTTIVNFGGAFDGVVVMSG